MRGNIDASLNIKAGDKKTVVVTGWIQFQADDPASVQVWVGVGQGKDKDQDTAVYGRGWSTVTRPPAGNDQRTTWQCEATTGGPGFAKGDADAGAVVIGDWMKPYPWGRDVKLKG